MDKPNVILIYTDQMRYDCTTTQALKLPGFKRLEKEGVNFTQAFVSNPLCCPFRASLFTGKFSTSHGMMANHYPIDLNQTFLPQVMTDNGYDTAWIGKWHLNGGKKYGPVPKEYHLGFEHFVGFTRGHQYLTPVYYKGDDETPYKSDMFEPDMQTHQLFDFIRENKAKDKPFFAGICYGPPHPKVELAPDYYQNLFDPEEINLPDTVPEYHREAALDFMTKYYSLVLSVDFQVQRVMAELEYMNILDNTIIIVVSDHGEMAYEHGIVGKKIYYDAAMHVPFMIRYPKLKKDVAVGHIVDPSVDIMPTILELCGINIPDEVEGKSLVTLVNQGKDDSLRDYVLYQIPREKDGQEKFPYAHRGIRTVDTLYVEVEGAPSFLFELDKDPNEKDNVITKRYPIVEKMRAKLAGAMAEIGDNWDKEMFFPPPDFQTHAEGNVYGQEVYKRAVYENK